MSAQQADTVTFLLIGTDSPKQHYQEDSQPFHASNNWHDGTVRHLQNHSKLVFETNDIIVAAFTVAIDALVNSITIQRFLDQHTNLRKLPPIVLHTGNAILHKNRYTGTAIEQAVYLFKIVHNGQIMLSSATYELIRDELLPGIQISRLGNYYVQGIPRTETMFQALVEHVPTEFPLPTTLNQHMTNLPTQLTSLIGREKEITHACNLLRRADVRLLTLTGPGGAGKTRLAVQAANHLTHDFSDGVLFVSLSSVHDPTLVALAIMHALGFKESGTQSIVDMLKEYLQYKCVLMVLDNFEQVAEAAPLVVDLLSAVPQLKILVTSRMVLRVSGEYELVVPPLALPDTDTLPSLDQLTQYESVRLFIERAKAVKTDFIVTNDNAPAVAEICQRLDGLPLAIELAAARIKLFAPAALLSRLSSRLAFLKGGTRDVPARQQTLRGAIDWSYDLLDASEQTLFAAISVFARGFSLEAAEEVCVLEQQDDAFGTCENAGILLDILASLVDKSLLRQEEGTDGEPRFVMLETIREYAFERLLHQTNEQSLQQRHAYYYCTFATDAEKELFGPQQSMWLQRFEVEHENFRIALQWLLNQHDVETAARLTCALTRFRLVRGHFYEGRYWSNLILSQKHSLSKTAYARLLSDTALLAKMQGDYDQAEQQLDTGIRLWREINDPAGIAKALHYLGNVKLNRGEYALAGQCYEESLALRQTLQDVPGIARLLNNLGLVAENHNQFETAIQLTEESLHLSRQCEDLHNVLICLLNLSDYELKQHNYERTIVLCKEGLAIAQELRDYRLTSILLHNIALAKLEQDDTTQAQKLMGESLKLRQKIGDKQGIAESLEISARLAYKQKDFLRATVLCGSADALRETIGAPLPIRERSNHQHLIDKIKNSLASEEFSSMWDRGRGLTPEQALADKPQSVPVIHSDMQTSSVVTEHEVGTVPAGLTSREVEVLRLVAQGMTNAQIADQLILSRLTVNAHLRSIYSKLDVNTRSAATRFAFEHELV
ncbi:MAG: tetratricopeptide repeat protein [Chloroflexota bacterium]